MSGMAPIFQLNFNETTQALGRVLAAFYHSPPVDPDGIDPAHRLYQVASEEYDLDPEAARSYVRALMERFEHVMNYEDPVEDLTTAIDTLREELGPDEVRDLVQMLACHMTPAPEEVARRREIWEVLANAAGVEASDIDDVEFDHLVDLLRMGDWEITDEATGRIGHPARVSLSATDQHGAAGPDFEWTLSLHLVGTEALTALATLPAEIGEEHRELVAVGLNHFNRAVVPVGHFELDPLGGGVRFRLTHSSALSPITPAVVERLADLANDQMAELMPALAPVLAMATSFKPE
jgi:hypothetical protein